MRRTPRIFHGWWIVMTGGILQLLQGSLLGQAYGSYIVVLGAEFGWTRTQLSFASALREMEGGIVGPFQGWLVDRIGPRRVTRAGIVIFGLGFMLFSQVQTLATFYAAFMVMAIGASLMGYLTITTAVVQWFVRRRSTALSLTSVGGAFGGVIVPLTVLALETFGWRTTAFASGVLVMAVGLPITQLLIQRPADIGLGPDGDPMKEGAGTGAVVMGPGDFTLREALREPSFWWMSLGHGFALLVVGAVNVHMISHLTETLGYSLGRASLVYSALTGVFMMGTLAGGWIGDHSSKRFMAFCCMGAHAIGMLLLSHASATWMVVAFVIIHGSAWGMRGPQMAALRADYFGSGAFGKIMGVSNIIVIVGAILGPVFAGFIYDQTGNYRVGFDLLAVLAALGSVFFALARRPKPRVTAEV
ncbi:MAG: MFS transporter [Chloroflexota bacterium]